MRNDSLKHLAIKRRNSNFTDDHKYSFYHTEKNIKTHHNEAKTSVLYETSSTMK